MQTKPQKMAKVFGDKRDRERDPTDGEMSDKLQRTGEFVRVCIHLFMLIVYLVFFFFRDASAVPLHNAPSGNNERKCVYCTGK